MQALSVIPLRNIMTTDVITLSHDDNFSAVYEKMNNHKIRHLPVVDDRGQLVGLITERDLFRAHSPRKVEDEFVYDKDELDTLILKHFMTRDPATLTPEHTLLDALGLLVRHKYGCIPIVEKDTKKLAGIISHSDILRVLYENL